MSFPAVAAEGQKLTIVSKSWLGDRQLYIDDFGRSWIMGLYGLEVHDGNVPEVTEPAEPEDLGTPIHPEPKASAEEDAAPEETTVIEEDEVTIVDEDDVKVGPPVSDEIAADLEPLDEADGDTNGWNLPDSTDDQAAELEAQEAADLALIDAGGDPFADEEVTPAQPDDPAAGA